VGAASGIAQERESDPATQQRLEQRIELAEPVDLSLRDAFIKALQTAGIAGGLEVVHCGDPLPRISMTPHSSVRTNLDEMMSADHNLTMDTSFPGTVILRQNAPGLLDVAIAAVEIPDFRNGLYAVHRILETPEVQRRLTQLKLEDHVEFGFSALLKTGALKPPEAPLSLRNVTFREALNIIARASGTTVWIYDERRCSIRGTFTISFAAPQM
jgi:hypothetical protein